MENLLELDKTKDVVKNIDIDSKVDIELDKNRIDFQDIVGNVIDKGTNYIIKAMPVSSSVKDILIDVKDSFKSNDFKEIIKTAVNSSIREGLEFLSLPKTVIKDITNIKDIASRGGLSLALSAGIDIITKKYMNQNVFSNIIGDFIKQTKDFLFSKQFNININHGIDKVLQRADKYKELCLKWFESYNKFDIDSINSIAKSLNSKKKSVLSNDDCMTQNKIIQNMTQLINTKKDKLSQIQLQICNEL